MRDLPRPAPKYNRKELARRAAEVRWEPLRRAADEERRETRAAAAAAIGELGDRELFLAGVALYWAEGGKDKEYDRRERVTLINSDPDVIQVYLAWLGLLAVDRSTLRFRVQLHESADIDGAQQFWADMAGVPVDSLQRVSLKKHNLKTVRHNTGADYRGCLIVKVLGGADLYRRTEGWWSGLVVETKRRNP